MAASFTVRKAANTESVIDLKTRDLFFVLAEGQHRRRRKRLVFMFSGTGFTQTTCTFVVPHDSIKSSLSASGNI